MLIFKIHFDIASNAGDHDLILSSRFRYSLNGNHFEPSQPSLSVLFLFLFYTKYLL